MDKTDKENECIDSHLNMCSFDIINETSEEVKYAQNKSKIVKLHQNHGICTFTRGVFYLGYDSRNEEINSLKAELEKARELINSLLFYTKRVSGTNSVDIDLIRETIQKAKEFLKIKEGE